MIKKKKTGDHCHSFNAFRLSFNKHKKDYEVFRVMNSIMSLSMGNCDLLHINVNYAAHHNTLSVRVTPRIGDCSLALCKTSIFFDEPRALEKLNALKDNLMTLIVDASS
ncbi:hypothetical protein JI57_04670 [Psychromonas sp. PRT-SC03]|nr:hypothetical protein JI57_04670 [Psychromonas sp. PRT-SC03]